MRRRIAAGTAAIVVAVVAAVLTSGTTIACSSESPTFEQAVRGSRAIALVRVHAAVIDDAQGWRKQHTLTVIRVLKGALPPIVRPQDPAAGLCGDSIAFYSGEAASTPVGAVAIVGFGMPYFDSVINPTWSMAAEGGPGGSAAWPAFVMNLEALETSILAATGGPDQPGVVLAPPAPEGPWQIILLALAGVIGVIAVWRRRRPDAQ